MLLETMKKHKSMNKTTHDFVISFIRQPVSRSLPICWIYTRFIFNSLFLFFLHFYLFLCVLYLSSSSSWGSSVVPQFPTKWYLQTTTTKKTTAKKLKCMRSKCRASKKKHKKEERKACYIISPMRHIIDKKPHVTHIKLHRTQVHIALKL